MKNFVACEELFPEWENSRILLTDWLSRVSNIDVFFNLKTQEVGIGFALPCISVIGQHIFEHATFSLSVHEHINRVANSIHNMYVPEDIDGFLRQAMVEETRLQIKASVQNKIDSVVNKGGKTPLGELAFQLGINQYIS